MKIVSNSFEYSIDVNEAVIYYGEVKNIYAKKVSKEKYTNIINDIAIDNKLYFNTDEEVFYYSFAPIPGLNNTLKVEINKIQSIKREFVKWMLYEVLKSHYIIDLYNYGSDLTIYNKNTNNIHDEWYSYSSYNLKIRGWEIHVSINSRNTLISKEKQRDFLFKGIELKKVVFDNHIVHVEKLELGDYHCLANQEIRLSENLLAKPKFPNYPEYYNEIKSLQETIVQHKYDNITLMKDGFVRLKENTDYFSVARTYNVMLFKNNQTNINAANGIKNYGPFSPPDIDIKELEFIYIYPGSEKAKELFFAFRSGSTAYFPGLERYVGIPIRQPSQELVLKYKYTEFESLPEMVLKHIQKVKQLMPHKILFALILLPKSKKDTEENDVEYFELKKVLLQEAIPSQFIDERGIGTNNFIYWLPNIAIAIHAKLGGTPWKLNRPEERELIVGFGDASQGNSNFMGSTVFFDNSGKLKASKYFQGNDLESFKQTIKNAIINFIQNTSTRPERLILHYFKIAGNREKNAVIDALKGLGLDIPFLIVTINDAKAKDFIAFDESAGYSMPMSGMAWKISKQEFVLFNNSRYEESPRTGKPPKQEYPIKLNIWFSNKNHYSEEDAKRIIGQVFEFSRIYWKSLMQQSKPVTAMYPEMIANYGKHFPGEIIPENWVTQNTPWFI